MATTVTETLRHTLTVTDSDFQLTVISGPQGPAGADSTVAGPAGLNGAAGPNSITSDTASNDTGNIGLNTLRTSNLAALSGTISVNSGLTMSANQSFGDGVKAEFGTGDDLEIYHDGTQSRIINKTGELQIWSQVVDGDITLYADGGTGGSPEEYIRLDGSLVGTQFSKRILFPDNVKIQLGATQDLEIYHDGNNSYIDDKGTGDLNIRGANLNLQKYTGETFIACVADGSLSLYHDNAVKLSTTTTSLLTIEPVIVDHLWKIFPPKLFDPGKQLSGLGYVRWYTRADGSCDLGVTTIYSVNLARVIEDLCKAAEAGDWPERQRVVQRALRIESQLEDREAFLVSNDMSVREVFAMFRKANDRLERDWEKNFKALFGDWSTRLSRHNPPKPQPSVCIPFL